MRGPIVCQPAIVISNVVIRRADEAAVGPLGWASLVVNGALFLNNVAVFRGRDGSLYTQFPKREGRHGQRYYYFGPTGPEAKAIIDRAILAAFRE